MIVVWLFLAVPWVSLQFVIVVFPDHTHLLLFIGPYLFITFRGATAYKFNRLNVAPIAAANSEIEDEAGVR